MLINPNFDLYFRRGDADSLSVSSVTLVDGAELTMTVRRRVDSGIAIQKRVTSFDEGVAVFEFEPEDTEYLAFAEYVYDMQLTDADGNPIHIIPPRADMKLPKFVLTEEVTTNA